MGFFCDTHYHADDYEDDDPFRKSKFKYRCDTTQRNLYKNRFYTPSYVKDLLSYLKKSSEHKDYFGRVLCQLVKASVNFSIETMADRVGKNALATLINYISRQSNTFIEEGKGPATIYDDEHNPIEADNYATHLDLFAISFEGEKVQGRKYIYD